MIVVGLNSPYGDTCVHDKLYAHALKSCKKTTGGIFFIRLAAQLGEMIDVRPEDGHFVPYS